MFFRGSANDLLENKLFHSQYEQHNQDYIDNCEKFGGKPLRGHDDYLIPHIIPNDDLENTQGRNFSGFHHN